MNALQIFTDALELATGKVYVSGVIHIPLRMPAYKEFTFTLQDLKKKEEPIRMTFRRKATNREEMDQVLEELTREFIAHVLTRLLTKNETIQV